MKALVRAAAGRPVAVSMVLLAVAFAGIRAAGTMPLDRLPEISVPRVLVEAAMPGLPAASVKALVAAPLEDALASAKGLRSSSSVSRDGRAVLSLEFGWGQDPARAAARAREIIDAAYQALPEGAGKPIVLPYDQRSEPLVVVSLRPKDGDMAFARRLAEYEARARLRRVEGAGAVVVIGGVKREAALAVDMDKAAARGLSVEDVARAVASENANLPAGSIRQGGLELVAVAEGRAPDLAALAGMTLAGARGPFRLKDIARASYRDAPRDSVFVSGGEERVALELYHRPGADPVAVAKRAAAAASELSRDFGHVAEIRVERDASIPIAAAIRDLALAGAIGAAAAAAALFALLGDAKAGALVAASIPVSAAATLGALGAMGRSLNSMSLGGLGLAVGMISDNAVVILDALDSRFAAAASRPSPEEIAEAAGGALAGTFGSMATTAVVFVPVIFLPGAVGGLFGDLAAAVICANVAGWLSATLALPAAYRALWSPRAGGRRPRLERGYRRALAIALRRPAATVIVAASAAAAGAALVASRPASFMPVDEATELIVAAEFPAGYCPDGMVGAAVALGSALESAPGIRSAFGSAGAEADDAARRADPGYARERLSFLCALEPRAEPGPAMAAALLAAREALPAEVSVSAREPPDPAARLLGLESDSAIAVKAGSAEAAGRGADELSQALAREAGPSLASIRRSPSGLKPRVAIRPMREVQAGLGLSLAELAKAVRAATEGAEASALEAEGRVTAIRVFAAGAGSADGGGSVSMAGSVPVDVSSGAPVAASALASFELTVEEAALARLDRCDVVYLEPVPSPGRGRELEAAVDRVLARSAGAIRAGESAFRLYGKAMAGALALVVVLLYLTLGAQFESFSLPVAIMSTIPMALAGTGPALAITGIGLDSGSALGLVTLFGVVVNNSILLHEASSAKRDAGLPAAQAAYAGASERVRPVLATTLTTVLALIPLCLSPSGAAQRSMSVAMLGGLLASTALTLFVSPILFARPADGRRRSWGGSIAATAVSPGRDSGEAAERQARVAGGRAPCPTSPEGLSA